MARATECLWPDLTLPAHAAAHPIGLPDGSKAPVVPLGRSMRTWRAGHPRRGQECRVEAARTSWMSWVLAEPEGGSRVYSLDILRGFMALSVALLHLSMPQFTGVAEQGTRLSNITNVFGPYGVEGFFMVSGFCFFLLYGETRWSGRNLATFHIKRFFRIAPSLLRRSAVHLALQAALRHKLRVRPAYPPAPRRELQLHLRFLSSRTARC